jgi:hypothetical protein
MPLLCHTSSIVSNLKRKLCAVVYIGIPAGEQRFRPEVAISSNRKKGDMRTLTIHGCLAAILLVTLWSVSLKGDETSNVQGSVSEIVTHGNVRNVAITIRNEQQKFEIRSDFEGQYSAKVVPGTYNIYLKYPGFCELHRGPFVVKANDNLRLNFQLMVCPSDMEGKYQYLELERVPHSNISRLVLFGNSRAAGEGVTEFTGPIVPFPSENLAEDHALAAPLKRYQVWFTYNLLAIRCDKLAYNKFKHQVIGTGAVEVQTASGTQNGEHAEVVLNGWRPKVNVE